MSELKYKLLSLDLDGTLLTPFKKITKTDLDSLKKYSDKGGEIFISTGKSLQATKKYLDIISKHIGKPLKFCACLNGNIIYDIQKDEVIYSEVIKSKLCKKIYETCKKYNIVYVPYSKIGINDGIIYITNFKRIISLKYINKLFMFRYMRDYLDMECHKINTIALWFTPNIMNKFYNELKRIPGIQILKTHKYFFEIVKYGSNKGSALKYICNYIKLPISKTVAIGDSYNDIPMFKIAGISYSVGGNNNDFLKLVHTVIKQKRNKVSKAISLLLQE